MLHLKGHNVKFLSTSCPKVPRKKFCFLIIDSSATLDVSPYVQSRNTGFAAEKLGKIKVVFLSCIKLGMGNQTQSLVSQISKPKKHLCTPSTALRYQGMRETNVKNLSKNKCMV